MWLTPSRDVTVPPPIHNRRPRHSDPEEPQGAGDPARHHVHEENEGDAEDGPGGRLGDVQGPVWHELDEELRLHDPEWTARLAEGPAAIQALVRRFKPFSAHRILLPFLEAYRVVGDQLECEEVTVALESDAFLGRCLALAKQYVRQRRIRSAESVSQVLFATTLKLAANRGLLDPATPDLLTRRRAFADELRQAVRRAEAIAALAASRRAGLID